MLADTDAGNVVTAAEAGSLWGYRLLPVLLVLIPVLIVVQDLAVRIGLFAGRGFGELIRERFGLAGGVVAAMALVAAALGSLITELTGIAGVGELYGVSRGVVLPVASLALIMVVMTGEYRRVERIALIFGLFELSFFAVAWQSHPRAADIIADIGDQRLADTGYLYLVAGLIGATFNPWMIFYQASAITEKRLTAVHYGAARWDTITGAILTQLATASVLVAIAALNRGGMGLSLDSIGQISMTLTPLLGETIGRAVFGVGVVGAAMAAAIVSSLACAWGLGEIFGLKRSLEHDAQRRRYFAFSYAVSIVASAVLVFVVRDLVWLSVGMQVLNALLLPIVAGFLVILAATVLPSPVRLAGVSLWLTAGIVALVAIAGVIGAVVGPM
jgi:Mn2+/Fe2+ NRAMP family transporter